jgi:antibiotic biosynthesis monooxygenase (ABM) superfamily enzyme
MRKTDKKIDNELRLKLTDVCEQGLKNSLMVVCVFDTNENLKNYLQSDDSQALISLIEAEFKTMDIKLKRLGDHIAYDSEENCNQYHNGNWALRLG